MHGLCLLYNKIKMKSAQVICLGEALVDRLGPIGGAFDSKNSLNDFLGGAPANVACGLAKLGIRSAFIGCLGNDSIGSKFCNLFDLCGVNTSALQIHETLPSRIVLVARDDSGDRSFGGFLGSNSNNFADQNLSLDILKKTLPPLLNKANWLVTGTLTLVDDKSREASYWTIDNAIKFGLKVAIDVNWRPKFWDYSSESDSPPDKNASSLILSFLEKASLLKLSREEALWFFKSEDPVNISKTLSQEPDVIVTDGSNSIKWFIGEIYGETKSLSPPAVVDTTGAGDSFLSGIIYQLVSNPSQIKTYSEVNSIIVFAAACGALVCGGSGAIEAQPSTSDVKQFLSCLDNLD